MSYYVVKYFAVRALSVLMNVKIFFYLVQGRHSINISCINSPTWSVNSDAELTHVSCRKHSRNAERERIVKF